MRQPVSWLVVVCLALWGRSDVEAASSYPAHRGTSPWSFTTIAEPSSRFVVNDTDSTTIDVYLYRSEGPIVIDVKTRRYVGPTDANGYLLNVAGLRARGIIGDEATITLPTYDVDEVTSPNIDCDGDGTIDKLVSEVDELFLNDQKIGTLTGNNSRWSQNSFTVPIGKLKFPSHPGQTATNRFRLDIDVANKDAKLSGGGVGCERWAVTIDWIGVQYEVSSPVVMVHGIRSSGAVFASFRAGLEEELVAATDNSITLTDPAAPALIPPGCPDIPYNKSIEANIAQLQRLVPAIAERFGSETLHFVAHSKGGLDLRGFLSGMNRSPISIQIGTMGGQSVTHDLEARSLVTLNTPHAGSVLAQYGIEAREITMAQAWRKGIDAVAAKSFEGAYYCDLTPERAQSFVASTRLPDSVQVAAIASDADCDGDLEISDWSFCPSGQSESRGFTFRGVAANRLYQLIGRASEVSITVTPRRIGPDEIVIKETPTLVFQRSDAVVSQSSAGLHRNFPISGWHHQNVHSGENAQAIAVNAQGGGLIDWRKR